MAKQPKKEQIAPASGKGKGSKFTTVVGDAKITPPPKGSGGKPNKG